MSTLRLVLIAVFSWLGIAIAEAQAPPPVPALPDAPRVTSYNLTASNCACAVNFALYGDSTDFQDWVEVWIDGVIQPYNGAHPWTITSPTGPLATIPRPVSDAVLTFSVPVTGSVKIVGARRPRRVSQFTESRGVPARDLNQAITDIVAMLREDWDRINDVTGRVLLAAPGNVLGILPLPSACISGYLGFDTTGLNPVCLHPVTIAGTLTMTQGLLGYIGAGSGTPVALTVIPPNVVGIGFTVPNNTTLSATPSTYSSSVTRLGFATPGDSPSLVYTPSNAPCALNAGAGDGGSQVPSSDGKCWVTAFPTGAYPTQFGAVCLTGAEDNSIAVQNWLNVLGGFGGPTVAGYLPASPCGFSSPMVKAAGNGASINGTGIGSELRYNGPSTTATPFSFGTINGGCSMSSLTLRDFLLSSTTLMTAGDAIVLNDTCHTVIDNVQIANNAGGAFGNWWGGLEVKGGNQVYVDNYILTGRNIPLLVEGDGSNQMTDLRLGPGIITGGLIGVDIAGRVGGATFAGADILGNGIELRISQDFDPSPNLQVFINAGTYIDATAAGSGVGIDLADAGGNNSVLSIQGGWVASATAQCVYFGGGTNWLVNWTGGWLINCGTDGIINLSSGITGTIDGLLIGRAAGYLGFSGYGLNCTVPDDNLIFKNITFISAFGTGSRSANCRVFSQVDVGTAASVTNMQQKNAADPMASWQYDTSGQTATAVANGANVALPTGSGMITIANAANGDTAAYLCGGGVCALLGTTAGSFVAPTTTPGAGKASIAYSGSAYAIYNNTGGSANFVVGLSRVKATN